MHELSLCRSIYGIVDDARQGRPVETVQLQVGQLRQVIPETLEHCWEMVTHQTPLEGSRLEIEHVPVELQCTDCSATTLVTDRPVFVCSSCDSAKVVVVSGKEFAVTTIDVREHDREPVHG